jgi:putative membrane protein insertion efficiency factor
MKSMVIAALQGYKRWISPMLPNVCRYVPTCSEYAIDAVERHGVLRGVAMGAWRVLRCNPLGGFGYDPVGHVIHDARNAEQDLALRRCCPISK